MFVSKYVGSTLQPMVAKKYTIVRNGNNVSSYKAEIGSTGNGLWKYYMSIGKSISSKASPDAEEIELSGNEYSITPIKHKNDGSIVKDNQGNIKYRIDCDGCPDAFRNDVLLFLDVPARNLKDIEYSLEGNVSILAKAIVGKDRGEAIMSSPALVLEVTGDFKLSYSGVNPDGVKEQGVLTYDYLKKALNHTKGE